MLTRSICMNRHAIVSTRIGDLTLVASNNALSGVYFPHHWVKPTPEALGDRVEATDPVIAVSGRSSSRSRTAKPRRTATSRPNSALRPRPWERRSGRTRCRSSSRVTGWSGNGSLTGYAGGVKRKQFLLDLEGPVGVRLF